MNVHPLTGPTTHPQSHFRPNDKGYFVSLEVMALIYENFGEKMSETHAAIDALIKAHKVILFMKGNKQMPQCGFSARSIEALTGIGVDFETVDVLSDPAIRQGIKDFSNWPTIPQLYVNQEFIGGCDIITQMHGSGELHGLLGVSYTPPTAPKITLTDTFVTAIKSAMEDAPGGGMPRLQVSPRFEYGFGMSQEAAGDFQVAANGLTILVDPASAERADGITLDFRVGEQGGIIIDNPNEPPSVRRIDVHGYKAMRDLGEPHHLFDVRTEAETELAHIDSGTFLDAASMKSLLALDESETIVLYCHHGIRSMPAAAQHIEKGFRKVYSLDGGIDAWSIHIDTTVPRY